MFHFNLIKVMVHTWGTEFIHVLPKVPFKDRAICCTELLVGLVSA